MYNNYTQNGVTIIPSVISYGDNITLKYDGILAKSGADEVYAHIGFGGGSAWGDPQYVRMNKTEDGYVSTFSVLDKNSLKVAFKDSANNWDNNSGQNYVFTVEAISR